MLIVIQHTLYVLIISLMKDCLNAIGKQWHPDCFVCANCRQPFGNSHFYLEDGLPYCEKGKIPIYFLLIFIQWINDYDAVFLSAPLLNKLLVKYRMIFIM